LDHNKEEGGDKCIAVGTLKLSNDNNLLAYTMETSGDETLIAVVKNLSTGKVVLVCYVMLLTHLLNYCWYDIQSLQVHAFE